MLTETDLYQSFLDIFASNKRMYWVYLLSSLMIALVYILMFDKERKINLSSKLWLHPSAILDYKYFILSFFIKALLIFPIVFSAKEVSLFIYEFLLEHYGYIRIRYFSYNEVMILFTISLFVFSDFTRYWLHRFFHFSSFLWEFHKIHHSAKVLTPITFYRVHPIENLLFGFRYSLSIGLISGVFLYLFGAMIGVIEVVGVNVILFVFSICGSNLRHSHIKLSYPQILESIFISPCQHQIHHSSRYANKNFGGYLACWVKVFRTIQYSNNSKFYKYGIETKDFNSINNILFMPFKKLRNKYAK